ncbi:MAG: EF-hand domain-containing protein [Burkholderiales bacterium]
MKKWLCVLLCCVATGAWAAPVEITGAPAAKARIGQQFRAADENGDGALTAVEARGMPALGGLFDRIDADHDGRITRDELETAYAQRARKSLQAFDQADVNHDGVLTEAELTKRASSSYSGMAVIDANHDGKVTHDEYSRYVEQHYYLPLGRNIVPNVLLRRNF